MWMLQTADRPLREKLAAVAGFIVNTLGLHYPRELTIASIISVVFAAHGKQLP